MTPDPLLDVRSLSVDYLTAQGVVHALENVSLRLESGQVVGVVGETGCGKSTLGSAIPRLLPEPPARVRSGEVLFQGRDLLKIPKAEMPMVRGTGIGMVLQEPLNSLNPSFRVFSQMAEAIRVRRMRERGTPVASRTSRDRYDYSQPPRLSTAEALGHAIAPDLKGLRHSRSLFTDEKLWNEALSYLRLVRVNDPERILTCYPHELSGGTRQRVMIAMVLSEKPALLIADEPTSALDVTIQAQVLTLMKELLEEVQTSILFISHDLGIIAEIADHVGVMYAGNLVEYGAVEDVFHHPQHPYTRALLQSIPDRYKSDGPLRSLTGSVPNLIDPPSGCPFHPRCPIAQPVCAEPPVPSLRPAPPAARVAGEHRTACLFPEAMGEGR